MVCSGKAVEIANANIMVPTMMTIAKLASKFDNLVAKVLHMSAQISHKHRCLSH